MPLLLLSLSLTAAAAGAIQAHRAQRSHRATAEALLRDYGAFANWSFRQHATERLRVALHHEIHPVGHVEAGDMPVLPESLLTYSRATSLDKDCCGRGLQAARYFFRMSPSGSHLQIAGADLAPAEREWLAGVVAREVRASAQDAGDVALLHREHAGRSWYIGYGVRRYANGARWIYGFELEPERYGPLFREILEERAVLPATLTRGRSSRDVLAVQVLGPRGRVLFASGEAADPASYTEEPLGASLGGLSARAAVRAEGAGQLIIGGLPESRAPAMLLIFGLAGALAWSAFLQLQRENRLARARSDFVSSVSHELRTPLAQVKLFFETLRLGRFDSESEREWIMDTIDRELTRYNHLLDNVLDFARAERGMFASSSEVVDLAVELREIVDTAIPLAKSRGVRIRTDGDPHLFARIQRQSFRQVILNLLDNAAKYGPPGQEVTLSVRDAGDRARITVDDQGPGVERDERQAIWEPFYRGRRAIGTTATGSGIGLSVIRAIVAQHGGTAWVEDAPDGGARFAIEIPAARAPVDGTPHREASAQGSGAASRRPAGSPHDGPRQAV